jgi:diaminopimelate epimerase
VCIPGGEVTVAVTDAGSYLRGPSVLVARGELSEEWWQSHQR